MEEVPKSKSHFIHIKCQDCGNVQVTFDKANMEVKCFVCGATLLTPTGGKAKLKGELIGVLE